jgi:hypothetical protein
MGLRSRGCLGDRDAYPLEKQTGTASRIIVC